MCEDEGGATEERQDGAAVGNSKVQSCFLSQRPPLPTGQGRKAVPLLAAQEWAAHPSRCLRHHEAISPTLPCWGGCSTSHQLAFVLSAGWRMGFKEQNIRQPNGGS